MDYTSNSNTEAILENLCSQAVLKWGTELQKVVSIEEMCELIQAISKNSRGEQNRDNIIEEIADVTIMLHQLKLIYGVDSQEFEVKLYNKLSKLKNILGN